MPDITPLMWFNGDGEGGPGPEGAVMMVEFTLDGHDVMALNAPSPEPQPRSDDFVQGKIALFITCETQAIVDDLWDKLSAGGEKSQCGWLRDKYGFSWNIVPDGLGGVLGGPDPQRAQRAMQAMLQMTKLDINELRRVYSA